MPSKFGIEDYIRIGDDKHLDFVGEGFSPEELSIISKTFGYFVYGSLPETSLDPTNWRCQLTGRIIRKQISAVRRSKYGSRYQRNFQETS